MSLPATTATHRQNVARVVSSLRPVRPHVPFYRLAAHRVPTLWSLYRGLLRASPRPIVSSHIQAIFREHRHLTSPALTKIQLEKGQRWLYAFRKAEQGDEYLCSVLHRFGRLICARRDHIRMKRIVNDSLSWQHRLLNRPIFSTALLRPSIYNGPLPRLKPQPDHISGMIHKRRVARARRIERQRALLSQLQDLQLEDQFERRLAIASTTTTKEDGGGDGDGYDGVLSERHFGGGGGGPSVSWRAPIESRLAEIQAMFERDAARATRPTPPDLLRQLKAARREKIANKTREREREMRGEVLAATRRRSRLGFPAHVLARWTPSARKANLIARRSVGEVGYVGQVKRALGYGVAPEVEEEEDRERIDRLAERVRRNNQSRRNRDRVD